MVTKDEPENIAKLRREVDKLEAEKQEREEMARTEAESLALKKKKAQLEFQKTNLYKWEKGAVDTGKKAFGWLAQKGEELTRPKTKTSANSHPVTHQAQAIQQQSINHPVKQQVQQAVQPQANFQMPDFGNLFGGGNQTMSSVKAKIQVKRRSRLKKKLGRVYKHAKPIKRVMPKIKRIPRMPRSPTITSKPKPFNINDVLKSMPQ